MPLNNEPNGPVTPAAASVRAAIAAPPALVPTSTPKSFNFQNDECKFLVLDGLDVSAKVSLKSAATGGQRTVRGLVVRLRILKTQPPPEIRDGLFLRTAGEKVQVDPAMVQLLRPVAPAPAAREPLVKFLDQPRFAQSAFRDNRDYLGLARCGLFVGLLESAEFAVTTDKAIRQIRHHHVLPWRALLPEEKKLLCQKQCCLEPKYLATNRCATLIAAR